MVTLITLNTVWNIDTQRYRKLHGCKMSFLLFEIGRTQILSAIQRGNQCRIDCPKWEKTTSSHWVPYPNEVQITPINE